MREELPDDLDIDDDLGDDLPNAMREGMDDEESLNGEGNHYLDKPDELDEDE